MDATHRGTCSQDGEPQICRFPEEALYNVLLFLGQRDIVRAQLVCKQWYACAQAARKQAFLRRWGFTELLTEPRSATLYETLPFSSIVRRHIVSPGENLPQLALRFRVDTGELMRLNNLMSPHLLQHRHVIYVPVRCPDELNGCRAGFEYCPLLCRDLVVTEPPWDPLMSEEGQSEQQQQQRRPQRVMFNRLLVREMQAHVRRMMRDAAGGDNGTGTGGRGGDGHTVPSEAAEAQAAAAASALDMTSARYYLGEADGSAGRAARLFVVDYCWEQRQAAKEQARGEDSSAEVSDDDLSYCYDSEYGSDEEGASLVRRMIRNTREQGHSRPLRLLLRQLLRRGAALLQSACPCCPGRRRRRRRRRRSPQGGETSAARSPPEPRGVVAWL